MRLSKEQLIQKIKQTLKQVGTSQMSQSPYDLGWLLRLPNSKNPRKPRYPQIISWLENLQHSDGSWGGQIPFAHDRAISTLSVIAGLSRWSLDEKWRGRIAKAAKAVEFYSKKLLQETEATVAFELLFPKLLKDCEKAGVKIKIPIRVLNYYLKLKKEKLSKLPIEAATKQPTTLLHALEVLDKNIDLRKFEKFQFSSGSFGSSPASTAYLFEKSVGFRKGKRYLDGFVNQEIVSTMSPIGIFERAWCLLPVILLDEHKLFGGAVNNHLNYLKKSWTKKGVGPSREFLIPDLDDTAVVFYLFGKTGQARRPSVFENFETDDGFMCFPGERSGSASYYAHLYLALSTCPDSPQIIRMREKIISFISRTQNKLGFWVDKWHGSPWYVTSRAIIALSRNPEAKAIIKNSVRWILSTQKKNGLWGVQNGTAEETAYVLMALMIYGDIASIPKNIIRRGIRSLAKRADDYNYPELWIGKTMFAAKLISQISILATLLFYEISKDSHSGRGN